MDRASSLIFPGSKTLAGWWRQLAPYQPRSLGVGYGFLHRIDAPLTTLGNQPVDPLHHLVLQALALEQTPNVNGEPGIALANLQTRLRLPSAVVQRVLSGMQEIGFLARAGADHWQMTEVGEHALRHRLYRVQSQERRVLPFLERLDAAGQRLGPAQFLPIAECTHAAWQVDDAHRFDPAWLPALLERSADGKQSVAFPSDIVSLTTNTPADDGPHILLDRPERVLLVLTLAGPEPTRELLGFAAKVDGWTLFDRAPVVRLPASAAALWPEWTQEPAATIWQEAWRSWCRQRQMPANEVEICSLAYHPPRLDVQAPGRLVQRLQASKSDLFRGEAWLLVGDGYIRTAAQLTIKT